MVNGIKIQFIKSVQIAAAVLPVLFGCVSFAFANETKVPLVNPYRGELVPLPVIVANSDTGFGFGAYVVFSKMNPRYKPYRWQGTAQFLMSVKRGANALELPTHDHFIKLDFPPASGHRLRMYIRAGYRKNSITGWYGLGNNTGDDRQGIHRMFQYRMQAPGFDVVARVAAWESLSFFAAIRFQYSIVDTYKESLLEKQIKESKAGTGPELFGYQNAAMFQFQGGVIWDSRSDETNPLTGSFYEISVRGSPGGMTAADHNFWGLNLSSRNYFNLYGEKLVAAIHLTADLMQGSVPFYELSKMTGLEVYYAVGSERGVRGVPAQRYAGKIKLFGSFELRTVFFRFNIKSQRFGIGATLFFDAGRVWNDWEYNPVVDGPLAGIKYGTGGGPRILWGKAVVIRFDVAYSPDADPVGFYVEASRAF